MKRFAEAAEAIAQTSSKLAKIAILAEYLRSLPSDADLAAAARFFTGNPFPQRSESTLAVGGRTLVAAAQNVWGVTDAELARGYRASGDLGAALAQYLREPADLGLFRAPLTPSAFMAILEEIAQSRGAAANKRRQILVERALGACESALEAKYVVKIVTGELRIGLREGLIVDGIAEAFSAPVADVRRAAMAAGDIGAVAVAAKAGTLASVEIAYGAPIAFMLASPLQFGSEYKDLAAQSWLVEDKYDGVRIQAHKDGTEVRLFSRRLNETSAAWPEIVEALRAQIDADVILDGEIVAVDGEKILPFRILQTRLQRKEVSEDLLRDVPVAYVVFDCLARDGAFLLDEPLEARREALAELRLDSERLRSAPWNALEAGSTQEDVHDRFEAARVRGNEGLVFKRTDAPYAPGKRGKWWLKLKRELDTVDAVVVAVEWGHGKRANVLSDYTFAVRGEGGELLVIGKAYSGLTDAEIATMTEWFLAHRLPEPEASRVYEELELARSEIPVEPAIVVEIAFDVVHRSTLHKSGYALRFPRIVRLRDDKSPAEIDTVGKLAHLLP
ncbi:MAG: ATP-dependent DNA ligase [Candidatus Eremiobacteraeota bacterium]|nr:ATP-dependent DNA ligase [Candidatus Eremiobacteraeota bacterium]